MTESSNGRNGRLSGHPGRSGGHPGVATSVDRLPPHNLEAEMGVLAAALLDDATLHDTAFLKADDFYRGSHQVIWQAILDLYGAGVPLDPITLVEALTRAEQFEPVGGDEYLSVVLASTPHAANARYHAQIVEQKSLQRKMIAAATAILRDGYGGQMTAEQVIEAGEKAVLAVGAGRLGQEPVSAASAVDAVFARLDTRRGGVSGLRTGWPSLDRMTDGLQPGSLIIVGGRPSMGKTLIGGNVLAHACLEHGTRGVFISLEMNREEIAERLLISESDVPAAKLRDPQRLLQPADRARMADAYTRIHAADLVIDDNPTRSVSQIASLCRRRKARTGVDLVVVDYLQLIAPAADGDTRQEQVALMTRGLKNLARELHVPMIVMCQLNRKVEERAGSRPTMADLRESGAIENDADLILLIHRPEYYNATDRPGEADLIVAKHRNGPTGVIKLRFEKEFCRFKELDDEPDLGAF